jgi:hypothetical protein
MFKKAVAVGKAGGEAKELVDMYFFETLVRWGVEPATAARFPILESSQLRHVGNNVIVAAGAVEATD